MYSSTCRPYKQGESLPVLSTRYLFIPHSWFVDSTLEVYDCDNRKDEVKLLPDVILCFTHLCK